MKKETFYCMTFNVSWQKYNDTLYVMDERDGCIYQFSGTSFDILTFIVHKKYSLNRTIDKISEKYNVERSSIEKDVTEFIEELEKIEILESVA